MGTAAEPAGEQKHGLWSYPQIKYRGSATPLLGSGGSGNSRSEEHRPGKWSKMQAGLVRWLNMRCTLIPLPCCGACRNRINHSTNHQCTAHVLRREGLQFYGTQNRTSTADAPLYQVFFSCGSMPRKNKNVRWQRGGLAGWLWALGRTCGLD
jgi:hypothetical protein